MEVREWMVGIVKAAQSEITSPNLDTAIFCKSGQRRVRAADRFTDPFFLSSYLNNVRTPQPIHSNHPRLKLIVELTVSSYS